LGASLDGRYESKIYYHIWGAILTIQKSSRIVLVDDDTDITTIFGKGLALHGFAVDAFNDPAEALKSFRPGSCDFLITDIRMPKMTGFELYREIRKLDPKIKVGFLTAFEIDHEEFKRLFPTLNVVCFIQKPTTIENLVSTIRKTRRDGEPAVK